MQVRKTPPQKSDIIVVVLLNMPYGMTGHSSYRGARRKFDGKIYTLEEAVPPRRAKGRLQELRSLGFAARGVSGDYDGEIREFIYTRKRKN